MAGTLLSLFITAYVCAFRRLLCRKLGLGRFVSCCLAGLFLELHFLVYVVAPEGNKHMFHSYNECCMFFYTIPALFCGALMMVLMAEQTENPLAGKGLFRQSVWVTAVYFAVFSNLYGSILLSVYAGLRLLGNFLKTSEDEMVALIKSIQTEVYRVNEGWDDIKDDIKQSIMDEIATNIKPETINTIEDLAKLLDGNEYRDELYNEYGMNIYDICEKNKWVII